MTALSACGVLLVAADTAAAKPLQEQLRADGFPVELARSAVHARALARASRPALVLLADLQEADESLALLAEIRCADGVAAPWDPDVPVLMLSVDAGHPELLRAFELGADDFVAAPPRYLELRARLRALSQRTAGGSRRRRVCVGPLEIDNVTRAVAVAGRPIGLSRLEYDLLLALAAEPHRVFTKEELMRRVWGFRAVGKTRTLDSHASRLRRKLAAEGGPWVLNVWGVGYRLTA